MSTCSIWRFLEKFVAFGQKGLPNRSKLNWKKVIKNAKIVNLANIDQIACIPKVLPDRSEVN